MAMPRVSAAGTSSANPTFLTLTFHAQNYIVINVNAFGDKMTQTRHLILNILGPFNSEDCVKHKKCIYGNYVFKHVGTPFGSTCSAVEKMDTMARLCALMTGLYRLGWRAVGDTIFEGRKQRGSIIFRMNPDTTQHTHFFCLAVPDLNLMCAVGPMQGTIFDSVLRQITTRLTRNRDLGTSMIQGVPCPRRQYLVGNKVYSGQALPLNNLSSMPMAIPTILQSIVAMKECSFDLETSFSVFANTPDLLMFGLKSRPQRPLTAQVWALTLKNPNNVELVNAPRDVHSIVESERNNEPQWKKNADLFQLYSKTGKAATCSLLRRLALNNWSPIACFDNAYKNSYIIFTKSDIHIGTTNYRESNLPQVVSVSRGSWKKLQYTDAHVASKEDCARLNTFSRECLAAFRNMGSPPNDGDPTVRSFDRHQFLLLRADCIPLYMETYIFLLLSMDQIGYQFLCSANVSGRHRDEYDDNLTFHGPHTWFFIKKPRPLQVQAQTPAGSATASVPNQSQPSKEPESLSVQMPQAEPTGGRYQPVSAVPEEPQAEPLFEPCTDLPGAHYQPPPTPSIDGDGLPSYRKALCLQEEFEQSAVESEF